MHEDRPIIQRDQRFGGNMERANVGAPYAVASRDYYGGPSKGSPMLDLRYENYQAPHRVDYTSPRQTGTPNFGGPMPGKSTYTGGYDFNPRPNLKGRFQEPAFHRFPQSGPAGAPVEGPWNREYDTPMMGGIWEGIGSLQEQANLEDDEILRIRGQYGVDADEARKMYDEMIYGYDRSEKDTAGLWQTWKKILERTGNEDLANQWLSGQQTAAADTGIGSTNEYQMAKVYTNQMPGMIDEGFFWDSLTPEAEAINKVLNMPGIEGMRQGSESDWNYDDYNKMIPDWLREQLPEEAFENLDDFRNQQRITT